jgi:hypothetical protein
MDSYTICRLYHQSLMKWFKNTENSSEQMISISDIPLESIFIMIFKNHPSHKVILISCDGKIKCLDKIDDPVPSPFKIRKYMKIDNKTSISSIKNVIEVFYQLINIEYENEINIIDMLGLLQFLINIQFENPTFSWNQTECITIIRQHFINGPHFITESIWKKEYREPILSQFFTGNHVDNIDLYENQLSQLLDCYKLIDKLSKTIDLYETRISTLEDIIIGMNYSN